MIESDSDRGLSPVVGYILTFGVTAILVGGLLIAAGTFVDDHRHNTAEAELQVLGQQLSADIAAADRLTRTDGTAETNVHRSLPNRVVGAHYTITIREDGDGPTNPYLELEAPDLDIAVTVGLTSVGEVEPVSIDSGDIVVEYRDEKLVIRNA